MKSGSIHEKNLLIAILVAIYAMLALFGLILAFLWREPVTAGLMAMLIGPFFPGRGPDAETTRLISFVFGVLGAVMLSWASLMAFLAMGPLRRGEAWAWKALLAAPPLWFLMDESFSLFFRVDANAIGNILILLWMLAPLLALRLRGHLGPAARPEV